MKTRTLAILTALVMSSTGCFGIFGGGGRDDEGGDPPCGECGGIQTGRLDLQGLSVQRIEAYECLVSGEPADCADYVIRFTLENGTALSVQELNQVELASPTTVIARTPFSECSRSTHTPLAGNRSEVIQVELGWNTEIEWHNSSFCESGFTLEPALPAPASGDVLVTIRGIYEDATTFEVTGSVAIQDVAP